MAGITRCLIVPFTFAALTMPMGQAFAQGAFPAALPRAALCRFHRQTQRLHRMPA
jgi:hypothetical protein